MTGSLGRALRIVAVAVFVGGVVGLVETALITGAFATDVMVRMGDDYLWLVPTAEALLFALLGLGLAVVSLVLRGRPQLEARMPRVVAGFIVGLAVAVMGFFIEAIHPLAVLVLATGAGVQAGRMAHGRVARAVARWAPLGVAGVVLTTGALAVLARVQRASGESRRAAALAPPPDADVPNVLLLVLDTFRAAELGSLGATGAPTPVLDALAARGVSFTAAIAPAPWTLPSHASIFTGRWPGELSAGWDSPMDRSTPVLAEVMGARGYLSGGFTGNLLNTARHTGLQRGFVRWRDYRVSVGELVLASALGRALAHGDPVRRVVRHHELLNRKPAPVVNAEFVAWLDALRAGNAPGSEAGGTPRPWFAFLNYFDPHEPHFPPGVSPPKWNDFVHRGGAVQGTNAWLAEKWRMPASDVETHREAYRAAVARTDAAVGDLMAALEARGELDNTVVIITSDHGEQLGERGLFEHHNALYMPALHVPLLILAPQGTPAGERVNRAVSLRDLSATILELVGRDGPTLPGTSLTPLWGSGGADLPSPAVAYLEQGYSEQPGVPVSLGESMMSIVELPWQYIRNGDGSEEFYDLRRGVFDGPNLAGTPADSALRRVRGILFRLTTGQEVPPAMPVTPRR